jgi:hypothetical protein
MSNTNLIPIEKLEKVIYQIRGEKVMLGSELHRGYLERLTRSPSSRIGSARFWSFGNHFGYHTLMSWFSIVMGNLNVVSERASANSDLSVAASRGSIETLSIKNNSFPRLISVPNSLTVCSAIVL